eukprot:COSAG06_NODE_210_length_20171_cov_14.683489_1_plen_159_part_10
MSTALTTVKGAGYVRIMADGETAARSPAIARTTAECERTQPHVDIVDPVYRYITGLERICTHTVRLRFCTQEPMYPSLSLVLVSTHSNGIHLACSIRLSRDLVLHGAVFKPNERQEEGHSSCSMMGQPFSLQCNFAVQLCSATLQCNFVCSLPHLVVQN